MSGQATNAAALTTEQKLSRALQPMLDATLKAITDSTAAQFAEVLLAIQALQARMDILEKLIAGAKKSVAKPRVAADGTAAPGNAIALGKPFPATKVTYFKQKFKDGGEAWHQKYISPALKDLMEADETSKSRTGDAKITAQANYCFNYIRLNDKALLESINQDYTDEKKAHEDAAKPAQLAAEPATTP